MDKHEVDSYDYRILNNADYYKTGTFTSDFFTICGAYVWMTG